MNGRPDSERLRVLLSAYACLPGWGTEPGVGWHTARLMARHHDVWVLTYAGFRRAIEAQLATEPVPGLHFVYHRLPLEDRRFVEDGNWRAGLAEQAHYYAWQVTGAETARRLHRRVGFDVAAHVTFVKYWAPSAVAGIGIPFVWGPVGGGESAPAAFYPTFSDAALRYERRRDVARKLFELDPGVRRTAGRATLAFATTGETRQRLEALGARSTEVRSAIGLPAAEVIHLGSLGPAPDGPVQFLSVGRLLGFKGFRFAIEAFARATHPDSGYSGPPSRLTILGDGPERPALEKLAQDLGVADRVSLPGHVSREKVFEYLAASHALVHPSLHESGGGVCLEAMAAGRPVICLDLGGSSVHVPREAGARVPAPAPGPAVQGLADAMRALEESRELREAMGAAGRAHVRRQFVWEDRVAEMAGILCEVAAAAPARRRVASPQPILARIDG